LTQKKTPSPIVLLKILARSFLLGSSALLLLRELFKEWLKGVARNSNPQNYCKGVLPSLPSPWSQAWDLFQTSWNQPIACVRSTGRPKIISKNPFEEIHV
jgi:hypothetical protein